MLVHKLSTSIHHAGGTQKSRWIASVLVAAEYSTALSCDDERLRIRHAYCHDSG